jgi:hypothetical protein
MTVGYNFEEQLELGKRGEEVLDTIFREDYFIQTGDSLQRLGIDRIFIREDSMTYTVEYKTDFIAHRTGNAYVEIWTDRDNRKPGWLLKSKAQILIYYIPGSNRVVMLDMSVLKRKILKRRKLYKTVTCKNETFTGEGLLVPLTDIDSFAFSSKTTPYSLEVFEN